MAQALQAPTDDVGDASFQSLPGLTSSRGDAGDPTANGDAAANAASSANTNIWDGILNSVKSSRNVPVRNVIVMGQPKTGKSTLLSALSANATAGFVSSDSSNSLAEAAASNAVTTTANGAEAPNGSGPSARNERAPAIDDLGMGYSYFDVGDEDDTVARVGVYQVPSTQRAHLSLLPLALSEPHGQRESEARDEDGAVRLSTGPAASGSSARLNGAKKGAAAPPSGLAAADAASAAAKPSIDTLRDSLVLIALDWEQPWTFLEQLVEWLDVLRCLVDEVAKGGAEQERQGWTREGEILAEMKERLEAYIRAYVEPAAPASAGATQASQGASATASGEAATAIVAVSNPTLDGEKLPLGEGVLTHNLGIPIVVVCTKADVIQTLEKDRSFKEEQFDSIQQVLRIVCLKYGAALFYTSHSRPQSLDILRSYVLHRLFAQAQPQQQQQAGGSGAAASGLSSFPFPYRASTVDRDTLLVPAGWDSWGKIQALREGFDSAGMSAGWEWDEAVERVRREKGLPKGSTEAEEEAEQRFDRRAMGSEGVASAIKLYEDIVSDWEATPPSHANANKVRQPDEQAFLAQHYAAMQKDTDPRSKFGRASSGAGAGRNVVGPVSSASSTLPRHEKALKEQDGAEETGGGASAPKPARRRDSGRDVVSGGAERAASSRGGAAILPSTPGAPSSSSAAATMAALGAAQQRGGSSRPESPSLGAVGARASSPGGSSPPVKQSEILQSFFQSLLNKDKPTGGVSSPLAQRSSAGADPRRPSREDG